jgi:hypothetical protein
MGFRARPSWGVPALSPQATATGDQLVCVDVAVHQLVAAQTVVLPLPGSTCDSSCRSPLTLWEAAKCGSAFGDSVGMTAVVLQYFSGESVRGVQACTPRGC